MSTQNRYIVPKKPPQRSAVSRYAVKRAEDTSQTTPLTEALQQRSRPSHPSLQRVTQKSLPIITSSTQPPLSASTTPTDDEADNDMDNEEIDKQLVMWAGRLELESIDLRDKSKGLIAELYQNSEVLQNATQGLTGAIKSLASVSKSTDKVTPDQLKKIASKLTEIHSSVVHLYEKLSDGVTTTTTTSDKDLVKKIDKISSDVRALSGKANSRTMTLSKNAIAEVTPKLKEIIELEKKSKVGQDATMRLLESFGEDIKEISGRLNDINTLQVAFSEQLVGVTKSQELIKREFRSLKERINGDTLTPLPLTPDSSLVSKPSIYAKRYRSQQRTRLERRFLQKSFTDTNSSYICLLSDDDNVIPEI